jgi:hypothetical protein
MNRYGEMLMAQLRTANPNRFAEISDPETVFSQWGQELESEILSLADALAGPDRPGESYLEKTARLSTARTNAEADLIREHLSNLEDDAEETPLRAQWQPLSRADPQEDDAL